jgi:hypothetical protein
MAARGRVAACSKETEEGMWKVVCVEGGDPVAGLELVDIGANTVDVACDIVATVEVGFHVIGGDFPRGCVS